ncbi:M13 family metallopeptidase [bacterium]|nr:M13 family metallopeptidase [bacterium]
MKTIIFTLSFFLSCTTLLQCASSKKINPVEQYMTRSGLNYQHFNKNIRPQDDLYSFVNGHWMDTYKLPADKSNFGAFGELHEQSRKDVKAIIEDASKQDSKNAKNVAALYQSYMNKKLLNKKGYTPLKKELAAIDAIENLKSLSAYMGTSQIISEAPFSFYVYADKKNPDVNVLYLHQSGLGLPNRDFYFEKDKKSESIRSAYVAYIQDLLSKINYPKPEKTAQAIMALETQLAQHQWTKEKLRDPIAQYNPKQAKDIKKLLSNLDWDAWLQTATLPKNLDGAIVAQVDYFKKLNDMITDVALDQWKAYFTWHMINSKADYLSQDFAKAKFNFYAGVLKGVKKQEPRWKRAVNLVNASLGEAVGEMYVKKHFPAESKKQMNILVENLRKAYAQSIKELDWMGESTKKQALIKLKQFTPKVGYPNTWINYDSLELSEDSLFANMQAITVFDAQRNINKLGKPVDREEWFMTPQTVNAYYSPVMNEIVFPAAILQAPFFNPQADDAVNYGAIGAVIGHEMGHGFDDKGSLYNGKGELKNWWTEQDKQAFKKKTEKLVAQFNAFTVLDGELHVNGEFTQGENIGDLSGLTIAYKAYRLSLNGKEAPVIDGYTGDQRFFMGWSQVWRRKFTDEALADRIKTDPHAPSEFRTNGTVMNMPEFMQAFDVKPSDKLYREPKDRVKIW